MSTRKPLPYRKPQAVPVTQMTARIRNDLYKKINQIARTRNVSMNNALNEVIEAGINNIA